MIPIIGTGRAWRNTHECLNHVTLVQVPKPDAPILGTCVAFFVTEKFGRVNGIFVTGESKLRPALSQTPHMGMSIVISSQ